jgi:hypothetical protein
MAGMPARVPGDPGNPGPGAGRQPVIVQRGPGPRNVTVEPACAIPVAGMQEGVAARRVRIPVPPSRRVIPEVRENARRAADLTRDRDQAGASVGGAERGVLRASG